MSDLKCGHKVKPGDHHVIVYEDVEYPYNPDWPLLRRDAGQFCSDKCLLDYLNEKASDV